MILKGLFLGILLEIVALITKPLVFLYAIRGRYPWWMVTPDDPKSPFGFYEPTQRLIYSKWGRYIGDVNWLALRNSIYGLRYKLKPEVFKHMSSYGGLPMKRRSYGPVRLTKVLDYQEVLIDLYFFGVIFGWKMSPIYDSEPGRIVHHPNMEARPTLSFRSRKALK